MRNTSVMREKRRSMDAITGKANANLNVYGENKTVFAKKKLTARNAKSVRQDSITISAEGRKAAAAAAAEMHPYSVNKDAISKYVSTRQEVISIAGKMMSGDKIAEADEDMIRKSAPEMYILAKQAASSIKSLDDYSTIFRSKAEEKPQPVQHRTYDNPVNYLFDKSDREIVFGTAPVVASISAAQ